MQVQLVLVRFGDVQDFHVTALHSHSQPLACRTVAQREDLGDKEGEERNQRGRSGSKTERGRTQRRGEQKINGAEMKTKMGNGG